MLKQLKLKNFKSIKKANIDFGRITVLIGPNGTGKSSIGQALMVARQSLNRNDLAVSGQLINLGSFDDILTRDSTERQVAIGMTVGVPGYANIGLKPDSFFSYDAQFEPRMTSVEAIIGSGALKTFSARWPVNVANASVTPRNVAVALSRTGQAVIQLSPKNEFGIPFAVNDVPSVPMESQRQFQDYLEQLIRLFNELSSFLARVRYIPAIRGFDQPNYNLQNNPVTDFVPGRNAEVSATFAYSSQKTREMVSRWSESITGSPLTFSMAPGQLVVIKSLSTPDGIPIIGDGFGTNQLMQLLLSLAIAPENSLVVIEEPEIHLHPKAQDKLCSVLTEIVKSQDKQLLITTHSEHIWYGFTSAVKRKALKQEELTLYSFDEKGKEPTRIEQDQYGDIYEWKKHYFM